MSQMEQDLIESFRLLQVQDDEWDELHKKILDERSQKNLTITEFLISCGLDPNISYFKQLCSKTMKRMHPSKRKNSPGREFREAVANHFAAQATASSFPTVGAQSLETIILDWCLDNRPRLRENRISDICLVDPTSNDLVVYAYADCTLSNDDILTMLKVDTKIIRFANCFSTRITASGISFSCVCQTASLVNVRGRIVALTCAHVLSQMFGKKVSFCEKVISSNKFKLDATGCLFGVGFSNDDMDFAIVILVAHLPVLVNEVEEIEVPVKLTKWWKEPLVHKEAYLMKSAVANCGIFLREQPLVR